RRRGRPWRARPASVRRSSRRARGSAASWRFYTCAVTSPGANAVQTATHDPDRLAALADRIRVIARELGFQRCGFAGIELGADETHLRDWLAQGLYGSMDWMARHGDKRARPDDLVPGTLRVISVGLDYGRRDDEEAWGTLADGERAYVA